MTAGKQPTQIILTQRALRDIRQIEAYSIEQWGDVITQKYLDKFDDALGRLQEFPGLLQQEPEFASQLKFYQVEKHCLVCDQIEHQIFILTIIHSSMDLPQRIGQFEPGLLAESELLHKRLKESKKRFEGS